MKIVHVIPYYQEGLGYEENHLGFAQAALGVSVSIVTSNKLLSDWTTSECDDSSMLSTDHLNEERYVDRGTTIRRLPPFLEIRRRPQILLRGLQKAIREEVPDIIHLHTPVGALIVQTLLVAKKLSIPVVIDCHLCYFNLRSFTSPPGIIQKLYYRLFKHVILPFFRPQINAYLPQTADSADLLRNELGIPYSRMTHVTLGTDVSRFKFKASDRLAKRKELGIDPDATVLLFVGRIVPEKDVHVLVQAASDLMSHNPQIWLLLIGPIKEEYRTRLLSMVPQDIRNRIYIPGFIAYNDLPPYYSASDIGVWPGNIGVAIIDGLSRGLPLVMRSSQETRHLLTKENALTFTRNDCDDLTAKITALTQNHANMQEMGLRSRQLAEEIFDWRKVAQRSINIYQQVLSGHPPSLTPLWENFNESAKESQVLSGG